jgi:hypothetical protein
MKHEGRMVLAALMVAALSLLAMPGGAAAKPGYYVLPEVYLASARLPGSNGYSISVNSLGPRLALQASRRGGSATYYVRAPFRGRRIDARFGKLGRISVRFEPNGRPQRQKEAGGCDGPATSIQTGRFVGTIRFRGEHGFTTAQRSSVKGIVFHAFRQVCKRSPEIKRDEPEYALTSVSAFASGNPEGPNFTAYTLPRLAGLPIDDNTYFSASVTDRRHSMTVTYSADATGEPDALAISPPQVMPAAATVSPPFPFSGSAALATDPGGSTTWTGDLSVELPGLGTVSLAGPSFTGQICRTESCACVPRRICFPPRVEIEAGRLLRPSSMRRR